MATDLERIKKIEQITRVRLEQVPFEKIGEKEKIEMYLEKTKTFSWESIYQKRAYSLDENNYIIGLSLDNYHVSQIDKIALSSFHNLLFLSLSNSVTTDYSFLKELKGLTSLDLSENNLGDVSFLKELKQLTSLNLKSNKLNDVSFLKELKGLTSLNLSNNNISDVSSLKELKALTSLILSNNNLSDVSSLKELKRLTWLNLSHNNLSDVSFLKELKGLTSLGLSDNYLDDISFLKELKGLRFIDIDNNPITNPPKEIAKKGLYEIRKYFEQEEKYGKERIYEAKFLLVGEPEAGKTTLMKKLFNPETPVPDKEQESTVGIVISHDLEFSHPVEKGVKIKVNVWDFGGQEIQYMLHQFFLTPDSLYLLVSDIRREDTRYDYWFQIIRLMGGQSARVIVVLNRINTSLLCVFQKDRFCKNFPELIIHDREIDLSVNDKKWELLLETIESELAQLKVVGMEVPKPWKPIREKLNSIRNEKYISIDRYFAICKENGIEDDQDQLFLLNYFHRIGAVLHFSEDLVLLNKIYLDPNWITSGIYAVFTEQIVREKNGEFRKEWLFERLKEKGYTYPEQADILNLMLKDKFDICYELKDAPGNYIVPHALPDIVPEYKWNDKKNLQFRFQYPFMPEGIISRLIVRLHAFIENKLVWKKGVILQRKGCRAEIVQTQSIDEGLKYIGIRVSGGMPDDRKSLLLLIRHEVDNIHKTAFPGMLSSEMVVCNCTECSKSDKPKFYNNEDIENFILKKKKSIQCRSSAEDVPIRDLVGAIYYMEEIGISTKEMMSDKQSYESQSEVQSILKELKNEEMTDHNKHQEKRINVPERVFFSYSHTDRNYRDEFDQHFAQLKRDGLVQTWFDGMIQPGDDWDSEIIQNLQDADIIILMLSPEFMNSKYIWQKEIQIALNRSGKVRIIPILLRPVDFSGPPLAGIQGIPRDNAGQMQWIALEEHRPKRDKLYLEVINELRKIFSISIKDSDRG